MWGMWGQHFQMGRRRGLRSWVLFLLRDGPKNGAEIMDEMEKMSQGWWRPSPGSVYPLLEELQKDGAVQRQADGRYALTAAAQEDMGFPFRKHPRDAAGVLEEMSGMVSYLEDLVVARPSELAGARPKIDALTKRLSRLTTVGA
jgi:DNA-binding PadR family transcriptional regulator